MVQLREEGERRSQQHELAERDLRKALEAEEERRRGLERRVFELESVAAEAKSLIEDMERARGRVGRALDALDPGQVPGAPAAPKASPADEGKAEKKESDEPAADSDKGDGGDKPHLRAIRE
jgi:hypothetical protein